MKEVVYIFIREHLLIHLVLIAFSTAAIVGAMAVDFIFGIMKARKRGEARTSTLYKKTATKAQKYFSPFMVLCFIDLLCSVIIPFPVFSMLWACYCIFCEFTSVREKSWEKEEIRKAERTMSVIIENKDDIAKLAAEIIFQTKEKEVKNESTN